MRFFIIVLFFISSLTANAKEQQVRCGWLVNPTPGNMWLIDRHASWFISGQGGYTSLDDNSLDLAYDAISNQDEFVRTNIHYGFSCACLTVEVNEDEEVITSVYSAEQLKLKQCLEDTAITEHIPLPFK